MQFSLRTLLVVMLVTAAFFGGRTPALRELEATRDKMAATERRAAVAIVKAKAAQEVSQKQMLAAEARSIQFEQQVELMKVQLIKAAAERALAEKQRKEAESQLQQQAAAEESVP
jgi:hypothetical protein